jgi:hypothetical protein
MNNRILKVLEKVSKLNDIFEWEVKDDTIFVCYKTPNNISTRHSYIFEDKHTSELIELERDIAKIEYNKSSQRRTDEVILEDFVEQYNELCARFPGVNVYGLEYANTSKVFAEIDHGFGRRVVKEL